MRLLGAILGLKNGVRWFLLGYGFWTPPVGQSLKVAGVGGDMGRVLLRGFGEMAHGGVDLGLVYGNDNMAGKG